MRDMTVDLRGVGKRYGAVTALDGLDLAIPAGGVTALLGPNGAGKSTAINLMLGRLRPDAGQVSLFGRDPRDVAARARVGVMLQTATLPQQLTVGEQVALFAGYYPDPRPVAEAVALAGLSGLEDRRCTKLSGGQQRRVQFALAIVGRPDLLVLDEPTVGLDLEARRGFWATVRDLAAAGTTVLLTTHHLEEADALADRVVVIDRGRVIADGSAAFIKSRVAGRIIRCRTRLTPADLSALPGVRDVQVSGGEVRLVTDAAEETLRPLLARDPGLADLTVTGAGLEEAFVALTSGAGAGTGTGAPAAGAPAAA
ncbi:MAG: hypothetical protein RLY86_1783 [Pseudomonadota bacterium]|jgi:ABC-2 type transport system ATP-binding protein